MSRDSEYQRLSSDIKNENKVVQLDILDDKKQDEKKKQEEAEKIKRIFDLIFQKPGTENINLRIAPCTEIKIVPDKTLDKEMNNPSVLYVRVDKAYWYENEQLTSHYYQEDRNINFTYLHNSIRSDENEIVSIYPHTYSLFGGKTFNRIKFLCGYNRALHFKCWILCNSIIRGKLPLQFLDVSPTHNYFFVSLNLNDDVLSLILTFVDQYGLKNLISVNKQFFFRINQLYLLPLSYFDDVFKTTYYGLEQEMKKQCLPAKKNAVRALCAIPFIVITIALLIAGLVHGIGDRYSKQAPKEFLAFAVFLVFTVCCCQLFKPTNYCTEKYIKATKAQGWFAELDRLKSRMQEVLAQQLSVGRRRV